MAFYDSGATFDSGLLYAKATPPIPPKKMTKPKLDLRSKSDGDLNAFAKEHITKMTGNPDFTTPDPDAVTFAAASSDFDTALAASIIAQQNAKEKTAIKDAKRVVLETMLTKRGKYVDNKSDGVKAKILSTGFDVASDRTPSGQPSQVVNLSVSAGDADGELDLQWDPADGVKSYKVHLCNDPATPNGWTEKAVPTKSKASVTGLTSGVKMWARVCGVGPGGQGAWSDPVPKIVP
jgi:hypothetical protein